MKGKTILVLTALFVFYSIGLCPVVSGLSLDDLIGPETARILAAGEKPLVSQFKNPEPQLLPRNEVLKNHVEALRRELDPSVMVEILNIYHKPENTALSTEDEAALYNGLLALSSLAGLQYYSASRGTMRTFYETSSVIDNPKEKRPLPDPVYTQPPAELTLYARQKDLTFGDNIYQYDYYFTPGAVIFIQQNLTSLSAGIIPAVSKNKLRSVVAILDAEEYILVYAASLAKAVSFPGMTERVGASFANRADAILRWFSNQADKAFSKVPSL